MDNAEKQPGGRVYQPEFGPPPFKNGYDAINQMLDGFKPEDIAMWLIQEEYWPDTLTIDTAVARVNKCKSANTVDGKKQFFKYAELVFLQWKTGRHYLCFYECDVLGRKRPEPRDVNRERLQLMQRVAELESDLVATKLLLRAAMSDETGPDPEIDANGRRLRFSHGDEA